MRRIPSILTLTTAVALSAAVAACGENSPSTPAERSPAVSAPAEGVPGLFRGLSPRLAKVAPACGIMMGAFEAASRLLSHARHDTH